MSNELSSRITMMQYDAPNQLLCGRVRLNGRERSVMPFKVAIGASASEKENKLIERAIKEQGDE